MTKTGEYWKRHPFERRKQETGITKQDKAKNRQQLHLSPSVLRLKQQEVFVGQGINCCAASFCESLSSSTLPLKRVIFHPFSQVKGRALRMLCKDRQHIDSCISAGVWRIYYTACLGMSQLACTQF